jgi:hypothetical protein
LNSFSVKNSLISNTLTPAVPTSAVIKLVGSEPGQDVTGAYNVCNPSMVHSATASIPYPNPNTAEVGRLAAGLRAWGTTLEPTLPAGTYATVGITYLNNLFLAASIGGFPNGFDEELTQLTSICGFIQADGTGFGICRGCATGGLAGSKK